MRAIIMTWGGGKAFDAFILKAKWREDYERHKNAFFEKMRGVLAKMER